MRLVTSMLVGAILSMVATLQTASGEQEKPITVQPEGDCYVVSCRFINEKGEVLHSPSLVLRDGQEGCVSDLRQSPFVVGVKRLIHPENGLILKHPHIVVLNDGLKATLTVTGQQPDGAVVDVTVERSKIGKVDTKQIDSDTTLQAPCFDACKKRVIDFVKLGETLVIPSGEMNDDERTHRVEIVVKAFESAPVRHGVPIHSRRPVASIDAKPAKGLVLGGVTPRIIIQEEEEERIGVLQP